MRHITRFFPVMLLLINLFLAGCGGSGTDVNDIFDNTALDGNTLANTPSGSGTVLTYSLSIEITDLLGTGSTVGAGADVLAKVKVSDSEGRPVANQPIKFEKADIAAPLTITAPIVNTAANGEAVNILKAGTPATTTDIIVKASTSVSGQYVSAIGIFRILRSKGNIINFLTTKEAITDPDGSLNPLTYTLDNIDPLLHPKFSFVQLVPFEVLDPNGIPLPRVAVKLRIYSAIALGSSCSAYIDSPEPPMEKTVTTDDSGIGLFNVLISLSTPPVGSPSACSVIYKATTDDLLSATNPQIYSYGGFVASLKNVPSK